MADSESNPDRRRPKRTRSRAEVEQLIARIARRQRGLVTHPELQSAGVSDREIRGWVARGRLHVIFRGVYAVGHTFLPSHAYLLAALLSCGDTAFLSHRSAAAARGLRPIAVKAIEVTTPGAKALRRTGLKVHRMSYKPHLRTW
jgi:predicted transcriptional regulator of viral defense system